jgi:hypothetical protein
MFLNAQGIFLPLVRIIVLNESTAETFVRMYPKYDLLESNCQKFVQYLCSLACPGSEIPISIKEDGTLLLRLASLVLAALGVASGLSYPPVTPRLTC